jgi:hypothetical protein
MGKDRLLIHPTLAQAHTLSILKIDGGNQQHSDILKRGVTG